MPEENPNPLFSRHTALLLKVTKAITDVEGKTFFHLSI